MVKTQKVTILVAKKYPDNIPPEELKGLNAELSAKIEEAIDEFKSVVNDYETIADGWYADYTLDTTEQDTAIDIIRRLDARRD